MLLISIFFLNLAVISCGVKGESLQLLTNETNVVPEPSTATPAGFEDDCIIGHVDELDSCQLQALAKVLENVHFKDLSNTDDPQVRKEMCNNLKSGLECMNGVVKIDCGERKANELFDINTESLNGSECRKGLDTNDDNPVDQTSADKIDPELDECVVKQKDKIGDCETKAMAKYWKAVSFKDIDNIGNDSKVASAYCRDYLKGQFECMNGVITKECGEGKAKQLFQKMDFSDAKFDKNVPECKDLDEYLKRLASGAGTMGAISINLLMAIASGAVYVSVAEILR